MSKNQPEVPANTIAYPQLSEAREALKTTSPSTKSIPMGIPLQQVPIQPKIVQIVQAQKTKFLNSKKSNLPKFKHKNSNHITNHTKNSKFYIKTQFPS